MRNIKAVKVFLLFVFILFNNQVWASNVAKWSLSNCNFFFSSMKPTSLNHQSGDFTVSPLQRNWGLHSCERQSNNDKSLLLNFGSLNLQQFNNNDRRAIRLSVTVNPHENGAIQTFSFRESQEQRFLHGHLRKYGLRVLKDGQEIFKKTNISTTRSWSTERFNFATNPAFKVTEKTTFEFEIFPYQVGGWNIFGALWHIDQIVINGHADQFPLADTCVKGFEVRNSLQHQKFTTELPKPPKIDATHPNTLLNMEMRQSCQWLGLYSKQGKKIYSTVWGYSQAGEAPMHMGPTIIAKKDVAIDVEWQNQLPDDHLLPPPDNGHHMAHPSDGFIPTVTHLHGGHSEPESDGYPTAWYTRNYGSKGEDWAKALYTYHNTQEAAPLWYHDHVLGMPRVSVNAGLAGMYLIRDDNELSLDLPKGNYEREIIIQDVQLDKYGQLARHSELPAFFGDYVLINGVAWPKLEVEPRKYRFRILNASDSRFYQLRLSDNVEFVQVGTEGGLINQPNHLDTFLIGPGERYDMVIDFSNMQGWEILLKNLTGILPGLPNLLFPSTIHLMKFKVGHQINQVDKPLPATLREPIEDLGPAVKVRKVLLGQALDFSNGFSFNAPIIDLLGTVEGGLMRWVDPVTEMPRINQVEIWEIYNTLLVPHPVHIHQVEFEIMDRQFVLPLGIDLIYTGTGQPNAGINPIKIGPRYQPKSYEMGWKDEVIVPPLTVTRVKMRFDILGDFVWHCHILTHEDHDMMRPLKVVE